MGADVNARELDGWTALMFAVSSANARELVPVLLAAGAAVSPLSAQGFTALNLAADRGDAQVAALLQAALRREEAETAAALRDQRGVDLLAAASRGDFASVTALLALGASEFGTAEGNTALIFSAAQAQLEAFVALAEAGFDLRHRNVDGHSAIEVPPLLTHIPLLLTHMYHCC